MKSFTLFRIAVIFITSSALMAFTINSKKINCENNARVFLNDNLSSYFEITDTIITDLVGPYYNLDNAGNHKGMLKPGDTLFIEKGIYQLINLKNISGTPDSPIVVMPRDGIVYFRQRNPRIKIIGIHQFNTHYVKIDGRLGSIKYGFYVDGLSADNLMHGQFQITGPSSHDEICGVQLHRVAYGFICKWDPTCDPVTWNDDNNKFIDYISVHDNFIDSTRLEGHYFGFTHNYRDTLKNVPGKPVGVGKEMICGADTVRHAAYRLGHIHIYNEIVLNAGWDAIQCNDVRLGWSEIDHNYIVNAGCLQSPGGNEQGNGLSLGGSNKIYEHDNYINTVSGFGTFINCLADSIIITRDTFINVQASAIRSQSGYTFQAVPDVDADSTTVFIYDNVIDSTKHYGIQFLNYGHTYSYKNWINNNTIKNSGREDFYQAFAKGLWRGNVHKKQNKKKHD